MTIMKLYKLIVAPRRHRDDLVELAITVRGIGVSPAYQTLRLLELGSIPRQCHDEIFGPCPRERPTGDGNYSLLGDVLESRGLRDHAWIMHEGDQGFRWIYAVAMGIFSWKTNTKD